MDKPKPRYKAREVKATLAKIRQRPIPSRTWDYWKQRLRIKVGEDRRYSKEHFEQLKGLVKALNKGWTIDEYIDWLILQEEKHGSESERTEARTIEWQTDPIEVEATAC